MSASRRRFLGSAALAAAGAALGAGQARAARRGVEASLRPPWGPAASGRGESSLAAELRAGSGSSRALLESAAPPPLPGAKPASRFRDPRRHFVFEYYPWWGLDPVRHWEQWDRRPPLDLASNYMPRLGAYDSRSREVIAAHARWIAECGAGGVNLSWWGRESFEDALVHTVMDVMRDHDLKVTFHLEPYAPERSLQYAEDVVYLLREYGERRGWDALLLLPDEAGVERPVLKSFRTILPDRFTDCHGRLQIVGDYTPDQDWARQTDAAREASRRDFDALVLLADSLDVGRTRRAGFDGVAVYDNFVPPAAYAGAAREASRAGLLFSLNANPGYDGIEPRFVEPGSCYEPLPFEPPGEPIDWRSEWGPEQAASRARGRIRESLAATVAAQSDPTLENARRGFLLVYVNSFNEWHEGHSFEPMRDRAALSPAERALGYHNPRHGGYRLDELRQGLRPLLEPETLAAPFRA